MSTAASWITFFRQLNYRVDLSCRFFRYNDIFYLFVLSKDGAKTKKCLGFYVILWQMYRLAAIKNFSVLSWSEPIESAAAPLFKTQSAAARCRLVVDWFVSLELIFDYRCSIFSSHCFIVGLFLYILARAKTKLQKLHTEKN